MTYVTESNLTDVVLERWKNIPDPRLREVMGSLIKHLHAFVRDIELYQQLFEVRPEVIVHDLHPETEIRPEAGGNLAVKCFSGWLRAASDSSLAGKLSARFRCGIRRDSLKSCSNE